jgi:hypothetical protein
MDFQVRMLLRLLMWFRRPPSRQTLWIIGTVLVVSVSVALVERGLGWPEWLTVDSSPRVVR